MTHTVTLLHCGKLNIKGLNYTNQWQGT